MRESVIGEGRDRAVVRKALLNGSLILGSLLFCVVVGEIVARLFFPDTRLKYENDPELLVRFIPHQDGTVQLANGSTSSSIRINELGLRGGRLNESSSRRILFLGDSFTFGWGVKEEQSFPHLVGYALREDVSVINGGQPGYGIYQMEGLLRRLAALVQPELVVLVIWEGLVLRQPLSKAERENFLRRSTQLKKLKSFSVLGTHLYRMYERFLLRFGAEGLVISLKENKQRPIAIEEQYRRALKADTERILKIDKMVRSYQGRLILVFWPRAGFATDNNGNMSSELGSVLKEFSDKSQIPFYSLEGAFTGYPPGKLLLPVDWHPTPLAHCLVAKILVSSLHESGYYPKSPVQCATTESGL